MADVVRPPILISALCLILSLPAWAAKKNTDAPQLSLAAGIVAPSLIEAATQNPAGLIQASGITGAVTGETESKKVQPAGLGGQLHLGNGVLGAMVGAHTVVNTPRGTEGASTFGYGGALQIPTMHTHFGISGSSDMKKGSRTASTQETTNDVNAGVQTDMAPGVAVGFAAYGLKGGADDYGAGVAFGLTPTTLFGVDASVNKDMKGLRAKPGFVFDLGQIALSAAYGLEVDKKNSSRIKKDFTAGISAELNQQSHVIFTHNQVAKFYGALVFNL